MYRSPLTKVPRFASAKQLRRHFEKHGREFGTATEADYETLASYLCDDPAPQGVDECIRHCADDRDPKRVRFNEATGEYAVMVRDTGDLVTYHAGYPLD